MESFAVRYSAAAARKRSVLCVGLDPTSSHIPPEFGDSNDLGSWESYLYQVVQAAATRVPVIKPQSAYYEAMGPDGIRLLKSVVAWGRQADLLVILDAKRTDIGATMEAYARSLAWLGVDACTFVPYLGSTFMPGDKEKSPCWMDWLATGKCAISMVRTSNPEANQLQDRELVGGQLVYEYMATLVRAWNNEVNHRTEGAGCVGAVVGATWPEEAERCRVLLGDDIFTLIPGYGAQGGGADGAVKAVPGFDGRIIGVVNSSRGITQDSWRNKDGSPKEGDPIEHVIAAIVAANAELNAALEARLGRDPYAAI